jgi:hypothetical protein
VRADKFSQLVPVWLQARRCRPKVPSGSTLGSELDATAMT